MIRVQDSLETENQIKKQLFLKSSNPKTLSNEFLPSYYTNNFANIDKSDKNLLEILELENTESSTMQNKLMIRDLKKKGHKRVAEDILAREEEAIRSKLKSKNLILKSDTNIEQCTDPLFFIDDKGQVDLSQCIGMEKQDKVQVIKIQKHIEDIDKAKNDDIKDSICKKITKSYKQEAIEKKYIKVNEEVLLDDNNKKYSYPMWMRNSKEDKGKKDIVRKRNKGDDNKDFIRYETPYRKYKTNPWEFEKNDKRQNEFRNSIGNGHEKYLLGFEEGKKCGDNFDSRKEKGLWKVEESDKPRRNYDKKYYGEKSENDYGMGRKNWGYTIKPWTEKQDYEMQNVWDKQSKQKFYQRSGWNSEHKNQEKSSNTEFSSKNNKYKKRDSSELDAWGYQNQSLFLGNLTQGDNMTTDCQTKWPNPQGNNPRNYQQKQYYKDKNDSNFKPKSYSVSPKLDNKMEKNIKTNEWTSGSKDTKNKPNQTKLDNFEAVSSTDKSSLDIQNKSKNRSSSPFSSNYTNNIPYNEYNSQKVSLKNNHYNKNQPNVKSENPLNQARNDSGKQVCHDDKNICEDHEEKHIWEPCYKKKYTDFNKSKKHSSNEDSNNKLEESCENSRTKKVSFSSEILDKPCEFINTNDALDLSKSILQYKNTSSNIDFLSKPSHDISKNFISDTIISDTTYIIQNHDKSLSNPHPSTDLPSNSKENHNNSLIIAENPTLNSNDLNPSINNSLLNPETNPPVYSSSYAMLFSDILKKPEVTKNELIDKNSKKICKMVCEPQISLGCNSVVIKKNTSVEKIEVLKNVLNKKKCKKNEFKLQAPCWISCCTVGKDSDKEKKRNYNEISVVNSDKDACGCKEHFNDIIKKVSKGNKVISQSENIQENFKLFGNNNLNTVQKPLNNMKNCILKDKNSGLKPELTITKNQEKSKNDFINHTNTFQQKISFPPCNIINKEIINDSYLSNQLPSISSNHPEIFFNEKSQQTAINYPIPQSGKINIILDEIPFKEISQSHHKNSDYNKQHKFIDFTNTLTSKLQDHSPSKSAKTQKSFIEKLSSNKQSGLKNCTKNIKQKKISQYFPKDPIGFGAYFPSDLQKKPNFPIMSSKSLIKNIVYRNPLKLERIENGMNQINTLFEPMSFNKTFGTYNQNTTPCFVDDYYLDKRNSYNQNPLCFGNDFNNLKESFIEKLPLKRQGSELGLYSKSVKKVKGPKFYDKAYKKVDKNTYLGSHNEELKCDKKHFYKEDTVENKNFHQQAWKQDEGKTLHTSSSYCNYDLHGKKYRL
ncbi:hypothetical protein SteCoe_4192 [Stentor coeruleus]|uniref:Uncharacterized protein n=1 Tax=Stentor coeruleus TaxID=5963 RepID=A0A1R2CVH1_9CILI|nr:hypothetical protein SteCoe_4192 [Stentor coeruleus]